MTTTKKPDPEAPAHEYPPTLAAAVLQVMGEVGYVLKEGTVSGGNMSYKFAGEADMLKAIRPPMLRAGLFLVPVVADLTATHETQVKSNRNGEYTVYSRTVRVVSTFRLCHVSGEHIDIQVAGEGQDAGDKATPKALTIALKYALRQTFLIETGDDPDRVRPEAGDAPAHREPTPAEVRGVLKRAGCRTPAHAEAVLRLVSRDALGRADIDKEPGECMAALNTWGEANDFDLDRLFNTATAPKGAE